MVGTSARIRTLRLLIFGLCTLAVIPAQQRADWIPVGSVPMELERRALVARAMFETLNPEQQAIALGDLERDLKRYGSAPMRIAAVPIVVDLLGQDYLIVEAPLDYRIEPTLRVRALRFLATVGGPTARDQLRWTLHRDRDSAVRRAATRFLQTTPTDNPSRDLAAVSHALAAAIRRDFDDVEIATLIAAVAQLSTRTWQRDDPTLLQALADVASGPYSSTTRRAAIDVLAGLAGR